MMFTKLMPKEKANGNDFPDVGKVYDMMMQNAEQMSQLLQVLTPTVQNVVSLGEKVNKLEKRLDAIDYMNSTQNKIEPEKITDDQLKNISSEISARVYRVLGLPCDEADYSKTDWQDYKIYFGKFRATLINDAKRRGGLASKMGDTLKENYPSAISYIREWMPSKGIQGLKNVALKAYIATH